MLQRWRSALIVGTAVTVALLLPFGADGPVPRTSGPPIIPDRIAGYSLRNAGVSDSLPGRAVALYQDEFDEDFLPYRQLITVGAHGEVYRRIDLPHVQDALLSPDGATVAMTNGATEPPSIALLDLAGGHIRRSAQSSTPPFGPKAWSPDGHRLAYIAGELRLLDVTNGQSSTVPGANVGTVAFSPDGTELAVQNDEHPGEPVRILGLDGALHRSLAIPQGHALAGINTWSPDGRLLATSRSRTKPCTDPMTYERCQADYGRTVPNVIAFVDATGQGAKVPSPVGLDVVPGREERNGAGRATLMLVGWTAPDRPLMLTDDSHADYSVIEVPLNGGEPHRLSSGMQYYQFQLASALLPNLKVCQAGWFANRGPWPNGARIAAALVGLLIGMVVARLTTIVLRRRRRSDDFRLDRRAAGSRTHP